MEIIDKIKANRKDLTDFVIHFTRSQNGSSSFDILKMIVQDGYFKCGWSFRGRRDTILGDKPAVCFTETPLYGFLDYVKARSKRDAIDSYGIALPKKRLYEVGGRMVLYGMTLEPKEIAINGRNHVEGLPPSEQYRYILTSIDQKNDWTHEREWRWANWHNNSKDDSIMPLWNIQSASVMREHFFRFCPIVIIVHDKQQADIIADILKSHFENERNDYNLRRQQNLAGAYIEHRLFSLDSISCTMIIMLHDFTEREKEELTIESAIISGKIIKMADLVPWP